MAAIFITMKQALFTLSFLLLSITNYASQLKYFNSEQRGLSNSLINQIIQDKYGYIWVATEDGISKFDGSEFSIYRADGKKGSLRHNYVRTIYEDRSGHLWIGTMDGIQTYDYATNTFADVVMMQDGDTVSAHVTSVSEGADGSIYIGTSGRGVLQFDGQVFRRIENLSTIDFVSSIVVDNRGFLWIAAHNKGVYKCNAANGEVMKINIPSNYKLAENAFLLQIDKVIYLSNDNNGLLCANLNGDEFSVNHALDNILKPNDVVSALATNGQNIYVGLDGGGLYVLKNGEPQRVEIYLPQFDFNKTKIHSIYFDKSGNMWLGLFQKGIVLVNKSDSEFVNYGYKPGTHYNIGSSCVMSVCVGCDKLWLGTDGDGLYEIDKNGAVSHIAANVPSTIMNIEPLDAENILLAGYYNGLIRYNVRSKSTIDINNILSEANKKYNKHITCIELDDRGDIWVGTYGSGAFRIDRSGVAHSYESSSEKIDYERNEPINNWISAVCTKDNFVWLGTFKGVCCYDLSQERFVDISNTLKNAVGQATVSDISYDNNGALWIATNSGVISYDSANERARKYTTADGLSSNVAVAVEADSLGHVWVSTHHGLSCIKDSIIDNYYHQNGLPCNEFSRSATTTLNDGRIVFGGVAGAVIFNPYETKNEFTLSNVQITNIYLNGREIRFGDMSNGKPIVKQAVIDAQEFEFDYSERSLAISFSTFDFSLTEQIRYVYRLEGFDNSWHSTNYGEPTISFTNMRDGQYKLTVFARSGNVSSAPREFIITVRPPWWKTTWAFLLYILIIISISALIYMLWRAKQAIRIEIENRQHQQQIDEARLQLFFNISHEIRTPLTLIINPIKELLDQSTTNNKNRHGYELIYRNAQRILKLINQMLDLRKIDKGQMALSFKEVQLGAFAKSILSSFESVVATRNISVTVNVPNEDVTAEIDTDNFDKVLYNIYSNAFKFVADNGSIVVDISSNDDTATIKITDDGTGIDNMLLEKIFTRFYQASNARVAGYTGTGIGLHWARSIVELHNGTIKASNRTDGHSGAVFTITIPLKHSTIEIDNEESDIVSAEEVSTNGLNASAVMTINQRPHLLIVDDEEEIKDYLKGQFGSNYKVTVCSNGKEAYDTLLKEQIDIVISDVMMPIMDGLTLTKKIKSNININHVPIVLLTAKHSDEDMNKGLLTGADAYIPKPFDIEILRNTVAGIINNRRRILSRYMATNETATAKKKVDLKSSDEMLMERITKYIDGHLADPELTVETLADAVGLSRVHLHRKLKELVGQSARDYIRGIRLRQAGILLGEKKLNVSEVAYALGFSNLSHFSTAFKEFYGMSPKEYMNSHLKIEN